MIFVWTIKASPYDEVRYSIRSVLKFHPEAQIFLIGDLPKWYSGEGVDIGTSGTSFQDRTRKDKMALKLFEEFVRMDDDFFLLEPFQIAHYYYGYISDLKKGFEKRQNERQRLLYNAYNLFPEELNYNQHTPLPVYSETVKDIPHMAAFKQWYCSIETRYPKVEQKDVKIRYKGEKIPDAPFFSTCENVKYIDLESMYPNPSYCENDR